MRNFLKTCNQNDRLGGWSGAFGYAVPMLEVFAVILAFSMLAALVASPVLLALVAPLVFAAYVFKNAKTVNRARSVKAKIDETVDKIKEFFTNLKPTAAGLLLKLTPLETLTRVSPIFEVQIPPPRQFRPV